MGILNTIHQRTEPATVYRWNLRCLCLYEHNVQRVCIALHSFITVVLRTAARHPFEPRINARKREWTHSPLAPKLQFYTPQRQLLSSEDFWPLTSSQSVTPLRLYISTRRLCQVQTLVWQSFGNQIFLCQPTCRSCMHLGSRECFADVECPLSRRTWNR
jgi:hypothetical protein